MSIKKTFLFGLTLADAIIREIRDPAGFMSFSYENFYGYVPESYKKESLYGLIRNLRKENSINRIEKGRFSLDPRGSAHLKNQFPLLKFFGKPWDGKWRVVGFDIEEQRKGLRQNFRKYLLDYGFRMLQKSLYISPLSVEKEIKEFLTANRDYILNAYIFVSDKFFFDDSEEFIKKIFGIDKLNEEYKKLYSLIEESQAGKGQVLREFIEISSKDPFLPKELLTEDFIREKLWRRLVKEKILASSS